MLNRRKLDVLIVLSLLALSAGDNCVRHAFAQDGSGSTMKVLKKGAPRIEGNEVKESSGALTATGAAVATIGGQSSKLEGDTITYDKVSRTLEARGHAKMFRNGFETKNDVIKFVIDEPQHLVTENDTVVAEPVLAKRRTALSLGDASTLPDAAPGAMVYQRQIVCTMLKGAAKAGVDMSSSVRDYESIEERVKKGKKAEDIQADLELLRQNASAELGQKQLLVDQFYGNGPLTKMCAEIVEELRKNWNETPGFEKLVYLFFFVQPDGTITDLETDDPVKYGPVVSSAAIQAVNNLRLGEPSISTAIGARPTAVPVVLSLSNDKKNIDAYVRHLNNDTYLAASKAKLNSVFKSVKPKDFGRLKIRILISPDGTMQKIDVVENTWSEPIKDAILAAVRKSGKLSPFPDGMSGVMVLELVFYNGKGIATPYKKVGS